MDPHAPPGTPPRPPGFATRAVHAGEHGPRPDFRPTGTPIYPATTFTYDTTDELDAVFGNERPGFVYSRYGNPTTHALEQAVAALEGSEEAVAYSSGMAAIHGAIVGEAQAGAKIVAANDVYGATYAVLAHYLSAMGIETTFVDITNLDQVREAVAAVQPVAIVCETVSNPLMRVADIPALAQIARGARATLIVDNTFASPYLVNPIQHGARIVVHSTTKYLAGHGDVTGGVVCTDPLRAATLREHSKLIGPTPGPFESWLTLRGLKTLPLRVRRQSESATQIAVWLAGHPHVAHVNYPGLGPAGEVPPIFNDHHRGGMISFEIAGAGKNEVFRFMEALSLCIPATTLGDVYTLVLYPAISSHRALEPEERAAIGIGDNLVRLSVGIEDPEDIIIDVDTALANAGAAVSQSRQAVHAD